MDQEPGPDAQVGNASSPGGERLPVILCLAGEIDWVPVAPLVDRLRQAGRTVLVARRPLAAHRVGRRLTVLERLPARLHAGGLHWVGVGSCAEQTFHTISTVRGVASVTLLEPCLADCEPGHPGQAGVPKLLIASAPRHRRRRCQAPDRFVGNLVGPVEMRTVEADPGQEEVARVLLEFLERVEAQGS